ncbi:endonuclease/exonuclease/phosphatase family protein [Rubrivirga sp.]|uniref:endonuclease/exonuclease/phosphatase family protein n=1 Tax=Rubrivirga sp. TaxID=1885344 RepID=UPI003C74C818
MLRAAPLLLAVALASCSSAPRVAEPSATARVMTFNIRLDVASDGPDAWPNRTDAVVATILEADIVGIQEATPEMVAVLDERLPMFERFGIGRDADGGGEQSAVLYRTDRFDLEDGGTFWLSPTPQVPGSVGWDAAITRIATWTRLRDRATSRPLVVVNTHFDHVGVEARRESAALLARRAPELAGGAPLVVMGDLNTTPDTDAYAALADLEDAWLVSETRPVGSAGTWNAFGRATNERRIDYVFVRGARVLEVETLDRTVGDVLGTDNPRLPSDHHAVAATVSF